MAKKKHRAAVIGAGVCGLTAARDLAEQGWSVEVFEKSRGVGGRLAAKRIPGLGTVDLGAQFITANTAEFADLLRTAATRTLVALWQGRIAYFNDRRRDLAKPQERWVGVPSMNAWLVELWPRQSIRFEARIDHIQRRSDGQWVLNDRHEDGFDTVVLAMPPLQAAALASGTSLEAPLRDMIMTPCWAGLVLFAEALAVDFDAAFIRGGELDWLANNRSKPDRTHHPAAWTIHAGASFSAQLSHEPQESVAPLLMAALATTLGGTLPPGDVALTHFWRYAAPLAGAVPGIFWDPKIGLGAGGDWSIGGRVEGAFIAGKSLAASICRDRGSWAEMT